MCAIGGGGGGEGKKRGCWVNELRVGSYSHNKEKKIEGGKKPNLSLSLSPLTISIRLHFLSKANSVVLGPRWMAALELRFNQ